MKNTFGNAVSVTLFGESHGAAVGAVIDGLAPGIKISEEYIASKMDQRRAKGSISTKRHEPDEVKFLSGVFSGYTTGTPLTLIIENKSQRSGDYKNLSDTPRPSHADYTAEIKYGGYQDYRGGGHFSGRITAALVAAGAILSYALLYKGIVIGTRILRLGGVSDEGAISSRDEVLGFAASDFPTLSLAARDGMIAAAESAAALGDSVGGVLESAVYGVPAGVGEPWFDTVEGVISQLVFSVPAVKGIEFGRGFAISDMRGSEANDCFDIKDGKIITKTNNSGGILGGITNGMPIIFRTAVKPTPSIYIEQDTVSLSEGAPKKLKIEGRHDPAIVQRARAVIDAVTAIGIADLLTVKYGTDYLRTENN